MWVLEVPAYLLLLVLIPPAIYLRHFWRGRGGKLILPYGIWRGRGFVPPANPLALAVGLGAVMFWLGVAALIVALSGPQVVRREQMFLNRGADVMIVLDESPTMAARDFQPVNRFESAKSVIREFISRRHNDPIGLVGFGAEASLRVPPTLDYDHVLATLDAMRVMEMGDGTAIGMGIAVAALHLSDSSAQRRVIILLTDGVNNAGEILPETAARAASSLGIQIYVIGVGSGGEVEVEFEDPETGRSFRGTITDGFDGETLEALAAVGGGQYFYAGSSGSLHAVFDSIDSVERVEERSLLRVVREPRDLIFILVGLICIGFDFLVRRLLVREVL
jgi:Ca-activated chloride channel family protein